MSKSLIFRIALIALIWILMANAGFGILLTLIAVLIVFVTVSTILFALRTSARVVGKISGR